MLLKNLFDCGTGPNPVSSKHFRQKSVEQIRPVFDCMLFWSNFMERP
jgi:hypothetical protein